jgi:hypothetical protein
MWPFKKKIKVHLGDELSKNQIEKIDSIFKSFNAKKLDDFWDISGCSELEIVRFQIGKEKIIISSESDEGVSIIGEEKLVNEILKELKREKEET